MPDVKGYLRWRAQRLRRHRRIRELSLRWDATAALLGQAHILRLEKPPFPPSADESPRWGYERPPHARLSALLARHDEDYRRTLQAFQAHEDAMAAIPLKKGDPHEPHWQCGFLWGLDAISLYCFIRERQPRSYLEVGSGNSTLFVDRARRDGGLDMRITSIDPFPRREIDFISDRAIREPLESTDLSVFSELQEGDVVFLDGTHRVFTNSDATVFFLDVLPELPPGVLVGIHDIHLPEDYPPEYKEQNRHYSEHYLLAAYLLAEPSWLMPALPCWYATKHEQLGSLARSLGPDGVPSDPGRIFWLQTAPQPA